MYFFLTWKGLHCCAGGCSHSCHTLPGPVLGAALQYPSEKRWRSLISTDLCCMCALKWQSFIFIKFYLIDGHFWKHCVLIHRIHVFAVACFCEENGKQNNAVIGQVPCGALWVLGLWAAPCDSAVIQRDLHMKGLRSRARLFPVFALKPFQLEINKCSRAVRLGGWAAAQGVYHLEEYL